MNLLVASVVLLWLLVIVLAILVILLYRQFGLIYIGSRGRISQTGLAVGKATPRSSTLEIEGSLASWHWQSDGIRKGTFVLMSAPDCQICADLIPRLESVANKWSEMIRFLVVDRTRPDAPVNARSLPDQRSWTYAVDRDGSVQDAFDVQATPFAFVVDSDRRVLAKGLVNFPESVEAMIQDALTRRRPDEDEMINLASGVVRGKRNVR